VMEGLLSQMIPKDPNGTVAGFEMNETMKEMMGGFTVLRLSGMIATMGVTLGKDDLLRLNATLNQIKKE